jgi:2'-5' RNA ligase
MPGAGRARRLFVALEIPAEVCAAVEAAFAPWRAPLPTARWVPPENLHVTVRFLGSVRPEVVDEVSSAVGSAAAAVAPFGTRLDGVGAFPSASRGRVLWAGLHDPLGRMAELGLALDAALGPTFRREVRAFRPHVTVARCDPPARLPQAFAATPLDPAPFEVVRAVLFESVPVGGGSPRYEPVGVHPLIGP